MGLTLGEILNSLRSFDAERVEEAISRFIKQKIEEAGAKGAVIGVSGGIDSAVTLALTARALGPDRVIALILPHSKFTPKVDLDDAYAVIESVGVKNVYEIYIDDIADSFIDKLNEIGMNLGKISSGNLLPRIRMSIMYSFANETDSLVVGSGDKSEIMIGYFTKFGDGGADIFPIGDLYKTRVRVMGRHLKLPENVVTKPSSPRLWEDHEAERELGLSYEEIDVVLYSFLDLRLSIESIYKIEGLREEVVKKVLERISKNEHKRMTPIIPKVFGGLTVGIDWRAPQNYKLV